MKEETKGLYLAIVLSTIAILAVNWIWPAAPIKTNAEPPAAEEIQPEPAAKDLQKQPLPQERPSTTITEALKADKRVDIANAKIVGSLRLKGARFDNLYLTNYKQTLAADSPDVELLAPSATKAPYYAEFGWLSNNQKLALPDEQTVWKAVGGKLTPESPLTLEWNNGQGLRFIRTISIDNNYMFTIG